MINKKEWKCVLSHQQTTINKFLTLLHDAQITAELVIEENEYKIYVPNEEELEATHLIEQYGHLDGDDF